MSNFPTDNSSSSKPRSIYDRAAVYGLWMGLYFSLLFLAIAGSTRWGALNLLILPMIVATPFLIYMQMRRTHIEAHGLESMSGLWLQGIITFCCGSLLLCATCYIFLRWCYPDFIYDSCRQVLDLYKETPQLQKDDLYKMATAIVENRHALRPTDIAVAYLWLGAFSGSVLSLILASIVKRTKIRQ